jgi:hypothetical protein
LVEQEMSGANSFARSGLCVVALVLLAFTSANLLAAAACVVAKKQGSSLAVEWTARPGVAVDTLVEEAKQRLRERGFGRERYEGLFPQANSPLEHGHLIVVRTRYPNARGRLRVSYGCGFSDVSEREAEWAALRDLQSYSWGWVPSKGYEVIDRSRY